MKCSVPGCPNDKKYDETRAYFRFPKDKTLQQKWLEVINRPDFVPRNSHMICEDHFKEDEIIHFYTRKQLEKNSIPSKSLPKEHNDEEMHVEIDRCSSEFINYQAEYSRSKASGTESNNISKSVDANSLNHLNNDQDQTFSNDVEANNKAAVISPMDNTMTCAVPHCPNTRNTKIAGLSFYDFPEEPDMKKKWLDAIGRRFGDLVIMKGSFVCSNHFIVQHLHMLKPSTYSLKSSQSVKQSTNKMQNFESDDYIEYNKSNIEMDDPLDPESHIDNEEINAATIKGEIGYESTIALEIEPTVAGFDEVEDEKSVNIIKKEQSGDISLNNSAIDKVSKATDGVLKALESSTNEIRKENGANEIANVKDFSVPKDALPIYSATGQQIGVYLPRKENGKKTSNSQAPKLPKPEQLAKPSQHMTSQKQRDIKVNSAIPMNEVFELHIPGLWQTVEVEDIDDMSCQGYESTNEPEQSYQNIPSVPPIPDKKISLQVCLQSSDEENEDSLLPLQYVNIKEKLRVLRKYINKRKAQIKANQQKLRRKERNLIKYNKKRNELKADNEELRKELNSGHTSDNTIKYKSPSWAK